MSTLWQDIRYALRLLIKNPGFSLIAIFTLALGIGANSTIFTVVNAVLLKPLPLPNADRLVVLNELFLNSNGWGTVSVPNLKDWREQNTVFEHIAAYTSGSFNLQSADSPSRIAGSFVTADYLDMLGVQPELGRVFSAGEDQSGSNPVVVLSDRLWRSNFGADPSLVGKTITLGGLPHTVIGVMPDVFRLPSRSTLLWVPLVFDPEHSNSRGSHSYFCTAKLKLGVNIEQARDQMAAIARRLEQQYPESQTGRGVRVMPLQEEMIRNIRPQLLVLLAAVGFVLLIACTNVANLLLTRGAARRREIAIRSSLGARATRLVRQFLVESLVLSTVGALLGLLLAKFGTDLLVKLGNNILPRTNEINLDWRVVGFTVALAMITGIGFGLVPALQAIRVDVQRALKESGSATSSSPGHTLFRSSLVVVEIASTLVLLVGAGLMIRSFVALGKIDTGFKSEGLLTFRASLPETKYKDQHAAAKFYKQVLDRIATVPGVRSAGAINMLPIQSYGWNGGFEIVGREPFPAGREPWAEYRTASPEYFKAMEIPLVSGRYFTEQDLGSSQPVFIINDRFAKKFWPNGDAVGHQLKVDDPNPGTIIGVVRDVKQSGLVSDVRMELFMPLDQVPDYPLSQSVSFVVRTDIDPASLSGGVRDAVLSVDPAQPIYNVETMADVVADSIADSRVYMLLLGVFAAVAMILAVVGIYGVISYIVSQRKHEIGIRIALGAQTSDVLKLVVGQGAVLTVIGLTIGAVAAYFLTQLMSSLLFGVHPGDPMTYVAVAVLLGLVAVLASYIPGRRATKVDPILALRSE